MRYVPEGTMEVWYVATVADSAAPTTAELGAGVDLTKFCVGDLTLPFEGTTAEAGDLSSRFNKTIDGDYGGSPGSNTFHKEKALADDTAWSTLPRDTVGFFAVAFRGLATKGTWAVGDHVDLWPISVLSRAMNQQARNTSSRFTVQVAIPDEPTEDFVLAI